MAFILNKIFDKIINECDGGGDIGGGISSGDVLGPDGNFEDGNGCLGKDDFHVPFPVMPCLFRWPTNWVGKNKKKKKTVKKTKISTANNPYVKSMKTIIAEDDNVIHYTGLAKEEFNKITGSPNYAYTGVLNYNDTWHVAWMIREDGVLHMYKPINVGSFWTIYATSLLEDGMVILDYKAGKYSTENAAIDAIYRAAKQHEKKLEEHLLKIEESQPNIRRLQQLIARGMDPNRAYRIASDNTYNINIRQIEQETKKRFFNAFDELKLNNFNGRWTATFILQLPDSIDQIKGQQKVATVIPQINAIMSYLRIKNIYVNSYDVIAKSNGDL